MSLVFVFLSVLFFTAGIMIFSVYVFNIITADAHKLLWHAYATEILIIGFILVPAYIGGWLFLITMMVLSLRGHWELFYSTNKLYNYYFIASYIISLLLISGYYFLDISPFSILLAHLVIAVISGIFIYLKRISLQGTNWLLFILYSSVICLLGINEESNGFILIFFLFVITESNDSFAYLVGKLLGKHKILPVVSPNKTLEGLLGGIVFSFIAGYLLNIYTINFAAIDFLLLMTACITCSITGDLVFSMYKRRHGIKDFSVLIGNQGGILDIYDSVLFTSVFYFLLLTMIG